MATFAPFVPTDAQRHMVSMALAIGVSEEAVSKLVINPTTGSGIDAKTLRKYFREEIDTGVSKANFNIGSKIYDKAMSGHATLLIWWSKARMGWRECVEQNTNVTATFEVTDARSRIAGKLDAIARREAGPTLIEGTRADPVRSDVA